jgi:sec-independent protein translocase protein TatA
MYLFSAPGILTIVIIALLLFGPDKLPAIAKTVGRFMAEFKRAQESVEATLKAEMYRAEGGGDGSIETKAPEAPAQRHVASDEDDEEEDEE